MSDEPEDVPVKLPRTPVFNIPKIIQARNRLMDMVFDACVGTVPDGTRFERMVDDARDVLAHDKIEHHPLHASLRHLVGQEMTEKRLFEVAWRLAGNLRQLKDGQAVTPWVRQAAAEWVPIQVVATRYAIQKKPQEKYGRSGRTMRFKVMAGTPCPAEIIQWWSNEKLDVVANAIGFKRNSPLYKADQAEFMSMRFVGLVEPRLSDRGPSFFHVGCPPSMLEYNRDLIKMRRRIDFACPEGFDHACHLCPLGVRSCEAAVHPEDYAEGPCPACGRTWWFDTDPGFVNDNCISCQPLVSAGIPVKKEPPRAPAP